MIDLERKAEDRLLDGALREVLEAETTLQDENPPRTRVEELGVDEPRVRRLRGLLELTAVAAAVVAVLLLLPQDVPPPVPAGDEAPAAVAESPVGARLVFGLRGEGDPAAVAAVFRRRLELAGIDGAVEVGADGRPSVGFPEKATDTSIERARNLLSRPGTLGFFVVVPSSELEEERKKWGDGEPPFAPFGRRWIEDAHGGAPWLVEIPASAAELFTGADLSSETGVSPDSRGRGWLVRLSMKESRRKDFAAFSRRILHRALAIVVDGQVESAPIVQDALTGPIQISGNGYVGFSRAEAEDLTLLLSAPPLPVGVALVEERRIAPVPDSLLVVPGRRVGLYRLGATPRENVPADTEGLELEFGEDGKLTAVTVTSTRYRSADRLGVGSTRDEVRRVLGEPPTERQFRDDPFEYDGITFAFEGDRVKTVRVHREPR